MNKPGAKVFQGVEITDTGTEGQGIGRAGELVIFVDKAVPGDIVDVEVSKNRKKLYTGRVINTIKASERRTEPECRHFGVCGGCKWQHMQYTSQLHFKQKQVYDALTRIGKLNLIGWDDKRAAHSDGHALFYPIIASPGDYAYRNRLDFAFSNRRWFTKEEMENTEVKDNNALGFHVPGMFDRVVDIEECRLMGDEVNEIRNELRAFMNKGRISYFDHKKKEGTMRGLIYRNTLKGEAMLVVIFGDNEWSGHESVLSFLARTFPSIDSVQYVINTKGNDTIYDLQVKVYKGKDHII